MSVRATALARPVAGLSIARVLPWAAMAVLFVALFWAPMANTGMVWWSNPDAGHGLLLGPLAVFLAWKRGLIASRHAQPILGALLMLASVALRYVSGLATELFTMRLSVVGAAIGLIVFAWGVRQVLHWWLPVALILLSVPLPEIVLGALALPLQFKASQMGAALLEWRHVPVQLAGNVINLPGHQLFVTEACSGLRSLSALLALGLLTGGLFLQTATARVLLFLIAIPIAILLNGIRVFLTGFFVFFVDPALGEGLMHYTEGWVMFVAAMGILGSVAWVLSRGEQALAQRKAVTP